MLKPNLPREGSCHPSENLRSVRHFSTWKLTHLHSTSYQQHGTSSELHISREKRKWWMLGLFQSFPCYRLPCKISHSVVLSSFLRSHPSSLPLPLFIWLHTDKGVSSPHQKKKRKRRLKVWNEMAHMINCVSLGNKTVRKQSGSQSILPFSCIMEANRDKIQKAQQ